MVRLATDSLVVLAFFLLVLNAAFLDPIKQSSKYGDSANSKPPQASIPVNISLVMLRSIMQRNVQDVAENIKTIIQNYRSDQPNLPFGSSVDAEKLKLEEHAWKSNNVNKYIENWIFGDYSLDIDPEHYFGFAPWHRAMIISGCYGNFWSPTDTNSTGHLLTNSDMQSYFKAEDTSFVLNIVLQQLENNLHGLTPHRDESICSCMKDFATPLIQKEENIFDNTYYEHDSCSTQGVQDYTFNADEVYGINNDNTKCGVKGALWYNKMINTSFITGSPLDYSDFKLSNDTFSSIEYYSENLKIKRNRQDPLVNKLLVFFESIIRENNTKLENNETKPISWKEINMYSVSLTTATTTKINILKNIVQMLVKSVSKTFTTAENKDATKRLEALNLRLPGFHELGLSIDDITLDGDISEVSIIWPRNMQLGKIYQMLGHELCRVCL